MGLATDIKKAAAGHGHGCTCDACVAEQNSRGRYGFDRILVWRILTGAALFIAALLLKNASPLGSTLLSVGSILVGGYDVFLRAGGACARDLTPDEDLLMCVVAVVAVVIGRAPEGALVILLVQAGALFRGYGLEKVRRAVEAASGSAAPSVIDESPTRAEDFIRHFSHIYTPVILGLAVLFAVILPLFFHTTVREAVYKALILMVIACPCAFVISVPLAYRAGMGGAARKGILFRSSAAVETLNQVGTVVFDKEGALEGEGLRVISVKSDRMDAETLLRIAAHACAYSDGDLAQSIKAAYQDTIYIELIQSFREEPGQGITVEVDGVSIILGTEAFVRAHGVDPGLDAVPETCAYLAIDGQYAGRVLFGAVARADAGRTVQILSWDNERQLLLLSRETPAATEKFARSVGIGQYYAECDGGKKASTVADLRSRKAKKGALIYVGAPEDRAALEAADLGIVLDAAGDTETALEAADVALTGASPADLVAAMETAKHTRSVALQNILFALAFKLIVLALDILGVCPLWLAVFADSGVTLAVTLNCLRALVPREIRMPVE